MLTIQNVLSYGYKIYYYSIQIVLKSSKPTKPRSMKKYYVFLLMAVLCFTTAYSATITAPTKNDYCLNTNATLGDIIITETANGDIAASGYIFLTAPTGFEFITTSGTLAKTGGDITATPTFLFRNTTVFAISVVVGGTANINTITLSSLQLKATALGSGTIQVGAGSMGITGITAGNTLGTVSTAITAITKATDVVKCSNDPQYTITGHSYTGGGGVESFSSCASCVSGTNFRPYNASPGSHDLTYTVTKSGCTFTAVSEVVVNAAPTVGISSAETSGITSNNNQICNNDNGTFTAFGADTYQFQVDGTNSSTTNPWTTSTLAVGARNVRVIGTETSTGCKDTSSTISVTIHPLPGVPTFNPTVIGFDVNAAGFKLDTLSPAATPAMTTLSYFTNGSGTLGIVDRQWFYPNIAGTGSHVITYHYVDGNGCENSSTPVEITVSSVPTPGVITGLNSQYCTYDAVDVMSILQTDGNDHSYQFQVFNEATLAWDNLTTTQTGAGVPYTWSANFDPATLSQAANGGVGSKRIRCYYIYDIHIFLPPFIDITFPIPAYTSEKIVAINPRPSVSIVNTFDGWSCQSEPAELLVPSPSTGGTPVFTSTNGGAGFITNSAGNYYVNRSAPFVSAGGSCYNVTLTFTDASTGCNNSAAKNVCIDRTPAVPTPVTPTAKCQGDFVTNLQMNVTTNGTVKWYRYNNGTLLGSTYISSGAGGSSFYSPGVLAITDTFTATMTNIYNTCTSAQSGILRVQMNTPATVDAGSYANFCSTGNVTLAGSRTPGGLGITWTRETGANGSFGAPGINATNPTYTPGSFEINKGSIKLYLTTADPDGANGCPSVVDSTTIGIDLKPQLTPAVTSSFICGSADSIQAYISAANASVFSVTWSESSAGTLTAPTSFTPFYKFNATESNTMADIPVTLTATSNAYGACTPQVNTVNFTIQPRALVAVPATITFCESQTISFTAVVSGSASFVSWGTTNGLGTINSPGSLTTTYTPHATEAAGASNIKFYAVTNNPTGPCNSVTDTVSLTINKRAQVSAGTDVSYCAGQTYRLDGTLLGSTSSITWSGRPVANFSNVNAEDPIYTPLGSEDNGGTYNAATATKAPTQITFTITGNDPDGAGPCSAESDDVILSINPRLAVDAGTDILVCAGQTINLNANVKLGDVDRTTTGAPVSTWSVFTGAGTVSPVTPNNFTGVYNPSGNMLTNTGELGNGGSITLLLTSVDPDGVGPAGPCPAASDLVNIKINQRARVTAGADTTYCANDIMELNGDTLTGSTTVVTWSGRPTNSFSNLNVLNPVYTPISATETNGVTYNPATGQKTPYQITFTITGNDPDGAGPCSAESDDVIVSINPKLTVNAGTDMAFCGHTLIPTFLRTLVSTANVKLGNSDRLTSTTVNTWSIVSGAGTLSGIDFNTNFNVNYQPSGVLADSGTIAFNGSGEFGSLSNITLKLKSDDPDGTGATGPCKADSATVNIRIYPRPLPHFSGFEDEYCRNSTDVTMFGNLSSTISGKAVFSGIPATPSISTSGDFYKFKPSDASISNSGANLTIRYQHTDGNLCYNYVDTLVRVFPIPTVNFTRSTQCQYDTITFTETATIDNSVFSTSEIDWDWFIDGDTLDNSVTPTISSKNRAITRYAFSNYGNHNISLVVTTDNGAGSTLDCVNRKDTTQIFGPYPKTSFIWSRPCSVDSVSFVNKTTIPNGYGNSILWTMGGAGTFTRNFHPTAVTEDDSLNPVYKYSAAGIYDVTLRAETNTYACIKDTTIEVYVVPTVSVTASSPYATSFASSNMNWAPSGQNYSWQHGTAVLAPGAGGKRVINSTRDIWITNLTGDYNLDEYSTLNSPCFDFSNLDKPMMTLNMWSNTRNLAGAVLEATVGNNKPWVTIGQIGEGKNWYNTQGIVGLIGANSTNPIAQGFSGELNQFDLSRIGLSQYANEDTLVRFRITFGSSDVNDALNRKDGIAFDSIWVGNRSKVVLIEHFTNSLSAPSIVANDTLNSYQAQRSGDMVSIHYHTSFPGTDNMNLKNPADPSSRVLYYGVNTVPRTQLDGMESYDEYGNTPGALKLTSIDNKALENAKFSLDISSKKTGLNLDIKTQLVAKEPLAQDVVLQVAVLERQISATNVGGNQSAYRWVLKKMLPDAAGSYISRTWAIGDTMKMPFTWDFNIGDFYDTSMIEVVAFVQNYTTKEVYQAARVGSNDDTGTPVITSVDVQNIEENLLIYPVPADHEINVLFGSDLLHDTPYILSDDLGRIVDKGVVEKGVRMLSFNSKKYAAGMYYLSLTKEDGSKLNRKIVVIH